MKLKNILIIITSIVLFYFILSFGCLTFNPAEWWFMTEIEDGKTVRSYLGSSGHGRSRLMAVTLIYFSLIILGVRLSNIK